MSRVSRESPAKINLTLHVGPLRPDGFHEIESLVARVRLCDKVSVSPRDDGRLTLSCSDPSISCDETNLALQAAQRLAEATNVRNRGAAITLEKQIPTGSGLGGGSSNAATVLTLLNQLWQTGLPAQELAKIGAEIGSDVPLFFRTPLCIVRGRGELVEDVRKTRPGWAVLILPAIHSTTRDVYAAWDRLGSHPGRPSPNDVLEHAASAERLMPVLFNDLQPAALAANPELTEVFNELVRLSDSPVRMTGSGSAFFHLFDARQHADAFAQHVRDKLNLAVRVAPLET